MEEAIVEVAFNHPKVGVVEAESVKVWVVPEELMARSAQPEFALTGLKVCEAPVRPPSEVMAVVR